MIYLHTLGDALIKVGEREIRPSSPLQFAALLYLGMERGRRVPRAALQELLFPNSDERSGAHSLRQLLYKLRQLGAAIEATPEAIWIDSRAAREIGAAQVLEVSEPEQVVRLTLDVLPGYLRGPSESFTEWLSTTRDHLEARARQELESASDRYARMGSWRHVVAFASALLQVDPLNENAVLAMARAHAHSGNATEALKVLNTYCDEAGSNVGAAVRQLRQQLSRSSLHRASEAVTPRFAGRGPELATLQDVLRNVHNGHASAVVICGAPGIGKTRLAQECAPLAAVEGFRVEWSNCSQHWRPRSASTLSRIVTQLLLAPGALGVSPSSLDLLRRLTEAVAPARPDQLGTPSESVAIRNAMDAAVADLLAAVTSETPLLLVLEDAHWSDSSSLNSLLSIIRNQAWPLLLLATTREPITSTRFGQYSDALIVPLGPLADSDAKIVYLDSAGSDIEEDAVEWAVRVSAGNPFFLRSLGAFSAQTGKAYELPPSLRALVGQSINGLSERARAVLEAAALLGSYSSLNRLEQVTGLSPRELLLPVRDLEQRGLLHTRGSWVGVAHDLLLDEVRTLIPTAAGRLLHGVVAQVLDSEVMTPSSPDLLWDCAEHWRAAGNHKRFVELVIANARHLASIGEVTAATQLLTRAKNETSDRDLLYDLERSTALVAFSAGRFDDVRASLNLLRRSTRAGGARYGSDSELELLAIDVDRLSGQDCSNVVDLLRVLATDPEQSARVRAHAAFILMVHADLGFDEELAREASRLAAAIQPGEILARFYCLSCNLVFHTVFGDSRGVESILRQFDELFLELPLALTVRHRLNCSIAAFRCGWIREAVKRAEEVYGFGRELSPNIAFSAASVLALIYRMQGQPEASQWIATAKELSPHGDRAPSGWSLSEFDCIDAIAKGELGAAATILHVFEESRQKSRQATGRMVTTCEALRLRLAIAQLDTSEIERTTANLLAIHPKASRRGFYDYEMEALWIGLTVLGRDALAGELADAYLTQRRDGFPFNPNLSFLSRDTVSA